MQTSPDWRKQCLMLRPIRTSISGKENDQTADHEEPRLSLQCTFVSFVIMTAQSRFSKIVNKIMVFTLHWMTLARETTGHCQRRRWNWSWCEIRSETTTTGFVIRLCGGQHRLQRGHRRSVRNRKKCANSHRPTYQPSEDKLKPRCGKPRQNTFNILISFHALKIILFSGSLPSHDPIMCM